MRRWGALLVFIAALAGSPGYAQSPQPSEFTESADFMQVTIGGRPVRLESLIVKRTDATGRLPIVLIAHGKAPGRERMANEHATNYRRQAHDFAQRGWLAVVVMRRGFGNSDGPLPVSLSCRSPTLLGRFASDADDLEAALATVSRRPDADVSRVIAIGVSAGGASVMALAARNPPGLRAAINVSGGLRFPKCENWGRLIVAFQAFGRTSRVPTLWIYAENDSLFGPALAAQLRDAFVSGGGDAKLLMLAPDRGFDGHKIFGAGRARQKWLPELDAFLSAHDLPAGRADELDALLRQLDAPERQRAALARYLEAPYERALAREVGGTKIGFAYGLRSLAEARTKAVESCRTHAFADCELVLENLRWIGPARAH